MQDKGSILNNKYFLYATEFFGGMSVMAVELGASRLLAPYFSSSQIVWTVIIGTIMIAMALGNIWGGRSADKNPDPAKLYMRLLIAAVWVAAIPFVGKYVIAGVTLLIASFVQKNFLIWASLLSCLVLFVFPLMLLGTITPSLAKYTVKDLEQNGAVVGKLGALNTIGSIIGTFLPTFVTIPTVGTAATFIIFASILALLSICYFFSRKIKLVKSLVSVILIIIFCISSVKTGFAFWEEDLVYEGESIYNYLQVSEDDEKVVLSTNVMIGIQSVMRKDGKLTGMYYDYALAAGYMAGLDKKQEKDLLILGMGTGTYAALCTKYFPGVRIQGVEIDEKIADLAKKYFELPDSVNISVEDGRAYLRNAKKYDVIMVDAYQDITIPFQMSTVEFFTSVKEHLKKNGVMVVNMNMKSDREDSINDYLQDTIASVFSNVYTVEDSSGSNLELFASMNGDMIHQFENSLPEISNFPLREMMKKVNGNLHEVTGKGRILTDDKAPVEVLGMKVIDDLISKELEYYRGIIKRGEWEKIFE